jgi:hypothetical protein
MMPAMKSSACEPGGPLGTLIPRGPLSFRGAPSLIDKYHNQSTVLFCGTLLPVEQDAPSGAIYRRRRCEVSPRTSAPPAIRS